MAQAIYMALENLDLFNVVFPINLVQHKLAHVADNCTPEMITTFRAVTSLIANVLSHDNKFQILRGQKSFKPPRFVIITKWSQHGPLFRFCILLRKLLWQGPSDLAYYWLTEGSTEYIFYNLIYADDTNTAFSFLEGC